MGTITKKRIPLFLNGIQVFTLPSGQLWDYFFSGLIIFIIFLTAFSLFFITDGLCLPVQQQQHNNQYDGKDAAEQRSDPEIIPCLLGHCADKAGTKRPAQISCHCQKCKQRRASLGNPRRGNADRSRPHNAYRKAAEDAADQSQNRTCGQ